MPRERATALLVDLDGVLRRWDPEVTASVERRFGLSPDLLLDTAMRSALLQPAITGQVTHADWVAGVADALAVATGDPERARAAVADWQVYRGAVDDDVLAFVREVRAAGVRVGLGTNATDALDADLLQLGLAGEVDVVANSSGYGVHKPSREFFEQACAALDTPPARVLFVDDTNRFVHGARAAGLSAYRWIGPQDLPYLRAALGL
jgi:putative hydrolase of the HAD superfamily